MENLPAFLADPLFIVPHKLGGLRVFIQAETAKGEPIAVGVSIDSNGRIQTVTPIHNHPDQTGKERMYLAVAMAPPGRIYAKNKEALGKAIASARASAAAAPATIALHHDSISSASVLTRDAVVKAIEAGKYKGDVRYSRAAQPQPIQQPVAQTAWQSPAASKFDDFVYKLQDKHIDLKRVVQAFKDAKTGLVQSKFGWLRRYSSTARPNACTRCLIEHGERFFSTCSSTSIDERSVPPPLYQT